MMHSHHSVLLNPSQHPVPPTEGEIPFFEDAFDTDSLRKFFQQHDSDVNSPSTILGNTRSFSEPQSSLYNAKSIFGSPISLYGQRILENTSLAASPDIPKRIIPFKSDDLFGRASDEPRMWPVDDELSRPGRVQRVASAMDRKVEDGRMEIIKGINKITINVAGRPLSQTLSAKDEVDSGFGFTQEGFGNFGSEYGEEGKMEVERQNSEPLEKSFMRKLVFTIEKSVRPKVIEKKEKVKAKAPILVKKNMESDELRVERKNSARSEKVLKKDSIDGLTSLTVQRKLSKESATSNSKKSKKKGEDFHQTS